MTACPVCHGCEGIACPDCDDPYQPAFCPDCGRASCTGEDCYWGDDLDWED